MCSAHRLRVVAALVTTSLLALPTGCDDDPSGPSDDPWTSPHLVFASARVDAADPGSEQKDLFRATPDGARTERITNEPTHHLRSLRLSPDGNRLLAEASWEFGCPNIFTLNPDGSDRVALTTGGIQRCNEEPEWSPDGRHIAFTSSREPRQWGWSAWVMEADGSNPTLVPSDSATADRSDWIQTWTPDGRVVLSTYLDSDGTGDIRTYVVNPDGSGFELFFERPEDYNPHWSPDGTSVAFVSHRDGNPEIYLMDADGSDVRRLTDAPGYDDFMWLGPSPWSPDGSRVAFQSDRSGSLQIHVVSRDGGVPMQLTTEPEFAYFNGWSPDGSMIAFESRRSGNRDVFVVGADGQGMVNVSNDPAEDGPAVWIGGR